MVDAWPWRGAAAHPCHVEWCWGVQWRARYHDTVLYHDTIPSTKVVHSSITVAAAELCKGERDLEKDRGKETERQQAGEEYINMQEDGGEGGGRRGGDGSVGGEDREMRNGGGDGDDDEDDGTRWNDMLKLVTSSRWRCLEGNVQAEEELKTLTILVESVRNETIRTSSIWKGPQIYENIISLLESTLSLACEAYQVCAPGNAAQYNIRGADEDFADRIRSIILHRYQLLGVLRFQVSY